VRVPRKGKRNVMNCVRFEVEESSEEDYRVCIWRVILARGLEEGQPDPAAAGGGLTVNRRWSADWTPQNLTAG